jgi:hypothetical protein
MFYIFVKLTQMTNESPALSRPYDSKLGVQTPGNFLEAKSFIGPFCLAVAAHPNNYSSHDSCELLPLVDPLENMVVEIFVTIIYPKNAKR